MVSDIHSLAPVEQSCERDAAAVLRRDFLVHYRRVRHATLKEKVVSTNESFSRPAQTGTTLPLRQAIDVREAAYHVIPEVLLLAGEYGRLLHPGGDLSADHAVDRQRANGQNNQRQ